MDQAILAARGDPRIARRRTNNAYYARHRARLQAQQRQYYARNREAIRDKARDDYQRRKAAGRSDGER